MDYKKDIRDTGLVSQSSSNGMVAFGTTLSKKCERIATAIYLVTNFLSDNEPMKARLRTLSLELVRDSSQVKSGSQMVETNVLEDLRSNIEETLSLFELAFIAGLVSEMNFTILKREYTSLRNTIEVKKASRESRTDTILGDNFFGTSEVVTRPTFTPTFRTEVSAEEEREKAVSKRQTIGQSSITMSDRNTKGQEEKPKVERTSFGPKVGTEYAHSSSPRATTDVAKESRRARILKLVKDNREVTIKDIATHFADLSEKTIQRELVSLVEGGVLKKFGERRWSRYALA